MTETGISVTQALLGEHAVFYALFDRLRTIVPATDSIGPIQGHASLLEAALLTHANLEEELLFAPLESELLGPVQVMRSEHSHIDRELHALLSDHHEVIGHGLAQLRTTTGLVEARAKLLDVLDFAQEHFAKEERVLFPMAQTILGSSRLRVLGQRWASSRRVQTH